MEDRQGPDFSLMLSLSKHATRDSSFDKLRMRVKLLAFIHEQR